MDIDIIDDMENNEDLDNLFDAMKQAKIAFDNYFHSKGIEGAYFNLELKGYVLDSEFKKWKEIILKESD